MKKQYVRPVTEQADLFAEEAVMLVVSSQDTTDEIWSQKKNKDGWSSDNWKYFYDDVNE